jgi:hypothetical protein
VALILAAGSATTNEVMMLLGDIDDTLESSLGSENGSSSAEGPG